MRNQIMVIAPYWLEEAETSVFDDPATDLKQEPFVESTRHRHTQSDGSSEVTEHRVTAPLSSPRTATTFFVA
jgi:hypothetical protein